MSFCIDIEKILGHNNPTFLYRFLDSAINSYEEPERANTRKGDLIGPSFKRNAAAAIMGLTTLTYKQAGQRAGLNPGSIGVWSSKIEFKEECRAMMERFREFVRGELKRGFKHEDISDAELYNIEMREVLASVLNIGFADMVAPMVTIQAEGGLLQSRKQTALAGIDTAMKLLDKDRTRGEDKQYIKAVLEGLRGYVIRV